MEALRQLPGRTGVFKRSAVRFSAFEIWSWYSLIQDPLHSTSSSLQMLTSTHFSHNLFLSQSHFCKAHGSVPRPLGPGADEGLAWMGAQLATEVVAPA